MKLNSKLLIIAGSDSSGGAGIQADIKTATSLGVYAMTAITAIIPEAENLFKKKIETLDDMIEAGKEILKLGPKFVLLKGGHADKSFVEDVLISKNSIKIFKNKKIMTKNTHGTGCTLSSAIASFISKNYSMNESCRRAIQYVHKAILLNPRFGRGHGPINHMALLK